MLSYNLLPKHVLTRPCFICIRGLSVWDYLVTFKLFLNSFPCRVAESMWSSPANTGRDVGTPWADHCSITRIMRSMSTFLLTYN